MNNIFFGDEIVVLSLLKNTHLRGEKIWMYNNLTNFLKKESLHKVDRLSPSIALSQYKGEKIWMYNNLINFLKKELPHKVDRLSLSIVLS